MSRLVFVGVVVLAPLVLAACSTAEAPKSSISPLHEPPFRTSRYQCEPVGDISVTVQDRFNTAIEIIAPNKTYMLQIVVGGEGAEYSDGTNTFLSRGRRAVFKTGEATSDCLRAP